MLLAPRSRRVRDGDTTTDDLPRYLDPAPHPRAVRDFLFLALSCDDPGLHQLRLSLDGVDEVSLGRGTDLTVRRLDGERIELEIPDPWCSKQHLRLHRLDNAWRASDLRSKNGSRIDGARFATARLHDRDVLEIGRTIFLYRRFTGRLDLFAAGPPSKTLEAPPSGPDLFRTLSPVLEQQLHLLRRAAPSPLPVLIHGESGTGKELAARAIHELSGRPGPFVAVNCGALSPGLLESELFGHVRGAFSGATDDRSGLIRAAHHGTLFLDELAEASHEVQVRMLRVLQEREVLPVGATSPVRIDVRVVAATLGDVHAMAKRAAFRTDFLARLTGFELRLPSLRERPEDIGHLTTGFLCAALNQRFATLAIDSDVGRALLRYPWPLNVRELEQTIGAAAARTDDRLTLASFDERLTSVSGAFTPAAATLPSSIELERPTEALRASHDHLAALLDFHRGNISAVARALSTSRTHIHRLLARHGLRPRKGGED
jgi:DNA-binding NtrC family response regulator